MKLRENQIVIDTMLEECNQLVQELRLKLKSKIDEIYDIFDECGFKDRSAWKIFLELSNQPAE